MKKLLLAPLCSALIIPGLGQIMNQEIKKGALLLGAVFLLFVVGSIKLVFILKSMVSQSGSGPHVPSHILEQFDFLVIVGTFF
jgi:TM2 domain-containing membrane protein YozV